MPKNPAAQSLIDRHDTDKKAHRIAARDAELQECRAKVNALLEDYDAQLTSERAVTVGLDGIERSRVTIIISAKPSP